VWLATPAPAQPITSPAEQMEVDVAVPATPRTDRAAPSAAEHRHPRTARGLQVSREPASPPDTPRKPKAVRIVSPPTLMHSRLAGPQADAKGKGKEEGPSKVASGPRVAESRKNDEKGWITVERRRRGGRTKGTKEAKIVDGRGVTSFWSTPEGLYESWRPLSGRYERRDRPPRGRH